jgi:23S rRNA G2069 N7-methylase RlmK/C1962 C5-methylase RlmI
MKKKLDVTSITNELEGGSAFFPSYKKPAAGSEREKTEKSTPLSSKPKPKAKAKKKANTPGDTMIPSNRDTTIPRYHDTTVSRYQDTTVSQEYDIEFNYLKEGIRTNANEIIRIATNYVVNDYKNNGESSILHKVIKKLNS